MILSSTSANSFYDNDLENSTATRCTCGCTCRQLGTELAKLIAAWPWLSPQQRHALAVMASESADITKPTLD